MIDTHIATILSQLFFGIETDGLQIFGTENGVGAMLQTIKHPQLFLENARRSKVTCINIRKDTSLEHPCSCLIISLTSSEVIKTLEIGIKKTAGKTVQSYLVPLQDNVKEKTVAIFLPDLPFGNTPFHQKVSLGKHTKVLVKVPPEIISAWN